MARGAGNARAVGRLRPKGNQMWYAELKANGNIQLYPPYSPPKKAQMPRCISLSAKDILEAEKESIRKLRRPTLRAVDKSGAGTSPQDLPSN